MGTEKRERQKAGRMARLEAEMKVVEAQKRRKTIIRVVVIVVLVVLALVLYNVFAGGDDDSEDITSGALNSETVEPSAESSDSSDTTAVTTTAATTATTAPVEAIDPICPAEDGSSERTTQFNEPPPVCIDPSQRYIAEFATTAGDFDVLIDPSLDEVSANNFVFLARYHAYDGTLFHRIIQDFVVQGGDVQFQSGTGNPGYRFTGGVPESGQYRVGSIAMANSGDASTNGSQFFIVTGQNGASLPPLYSLFGHVIDGLDVALAMQSVATGPGDAPLEDVVANTVTIRDATDDEIAAYEAAIAG